MNRSNVFTCHQIQSNDVKHLFSGNENCNVLGAYYKSPNVQLVK